MGCPLFMYVYLCFVYGHNGEDIKNYRLVVDGQPLLHPIEPSGVTDVYTQEKGWVSEEFDIDHIISKSDTSHNSLKSIKLIVEYLI